MREILLRRRGMTGRGSPYAHGSWEDLFYHVDRGDYAAAYQQGETIPLNLGPTYGVVNMEISDFDYDVLASDTAKRAPVTMVAKELLAARHRWNPNLEETEPPYPEGTGTIGGWPLSELRAWMVENVLPAIPLEVRKRIVEVAKYSMGFMPDGERNRSYSSNDRIFVPSAHECGRIAEIGRAGGYHALDSEEKRTKHTAASGTPIQWWSRSSVYTGGQNRAFAIAVNGATGAQTNNQAPGNTLGICLCFCIGGME